MKGMNEKIDNDEKNHQGEENDAGGQEEENEEEYNNNDVYCLPSNFLIGTATSSYQVEGGYNQTGRTPSIWDIFCRERPGLQCANVADDMIHRYKSDVERMANMGLSSYRFSISWSRVMTWDENSKQMKPNEKGLEFYRELINELVSHDIVPIITLFHWDLPQSLHDHLKPPGFLSSDIVNHFVDYSRLVFTQFGQLGVLYWSTFNEPFTFAQEGYGWGNKAPGYGNSPTNAYLVAHHILLSHAASVQVFRELQGQEQQKQVQQQLQNPASTLTSMVVSKDAKIGMNLNYEYRFPSDPNNALDLEASQRSHEFGLGWFLNPLIHGNYPSTMKERAGDRLPSFTKEQSRLVAKSYDVLMLNHYSSRLATNCDSPTSRIECESLTVGWQRDLGVDDSLFPLESRVASVGNDGKPNCAWFNGYPIGYLETIRYMHSRDPATPILLTENGWCGNSTVINNDQLWYHRRYLQQVVYAIRDYNIPILGYTVWSLLDNYEWGSFQPRFGLFFVEYTNKTGSYDGYVPNRNDLKRIPRPAAHYISNVAKTNCVPMMTRATARRGTIPMAMATAANMNILQSTPCSRLFGMIVLLIVVFILIRRQRDCQWSKLLMPKTALQYNEVP